MKSKFSLIVIFYFICYFNLFPSTSKEESNGLLSEEAVKNIYDLSKIKKDFSKFIVFVQGIGESTGIIIHSHFIIINNHSVPDSKSISVTLWDNDNNIHNNKKFIGYVVSQSESEDLALVYIEEDLLIDNSRLQFYTDDIFTLETEEVFAIGNPNGWVGCWSYTKGYIAKSPSLCIKDNIKFIGMTAALDTYHGSSGSAVFNKSGEFIGLTSMLLTGTRFTDIVPAPIILKFLETSLEMFLQTLNKNITPNTLSEKR